MLACQTVQCLALTKQTNKQTNKQHQQYSHVHQPTNAVLRLHLLRLGQRQTANVEVCGHWCSLTVPLPLLCFVRMNLLNLLIV